MHYTQHGSEIIVLLAGGDKRTQEEDIKTAIRLARDAGLSRESLYKALSGERSPDFDTILRAINALGLELHAEVGRG